MQHRKTQKIGESVFKREILWVFFCIVDFCNLVVFVSLWGIALCRGAEVAFFCML